MFSYASSANRVVTSPLLVTYSCERMVTDNKTWYKVTRNATKQYSYVDMTANAAAIALAAKTSLYTRSTRICISREKDVTLETIQSSVSTKRNGNGAYDVVVSVNETDTTHASSVPSDPSVLFTAENARDYDDADEESSGMTTSAEFDSSASTMTISISVSGDLIGVLPSELKLYHYENGELVQVTSGLTVTQTGDNTYQLIASGWSGDDNTGVVTAMGYTTSWEREIDSFTISAEVASAEYGTDNKRHIVYADIKLVATLSGKYRGQGESVVWYDFGGDVITPTVESVDEHTVTATYSVKGNFDEGAVIAGFDAKIGSDESGYVSVYNPLAPTLAITSDVTVEDYTVSTDNYYKITVGFYTEGEAYNGSKYVTMTLFDSSGNEIPWSGSSGSAMGTASSVEGIIYQSKLPAGSYSVRLSLQASKRLLTATEAFVIS